MYFYLFICHQLSLANKTTNGSSGEATAAAPAPPSYEEAIAGMNMPYCALYNVITVSMHSTYSESLNACHVQYMLARGKHEVKPQKGNCLLQNTVNSLHRRQQSLLQ